jgi:recombination protein RecA
MGRLEDFLATLDPKVAKAVQTAQEVEVERLPVISYGMTSALGGGFGRGRIATVYGNQSAGKSMLFQETIGKLWQPMGLVGAYVDAETAFDKDWTAKLGMDNEETILIKSKSSGRIEKELVPLMDADLDYCVIDSISDIMPEAFVDEHGNMNEQDKRKQMGAHAKAITALINGLLYVNKETCIILLSQTTTKFENWGPVQVPHGGNKTLFASSQIVRLTSSNSETNSIKGDVWVGEKVFELPIGRKVRGVVEKNKLGAQSRTFAYNMYYDGPEVGIDRVGEIIEVATDLDVIKKGGSWYTYGDLKWQGDKKVITHFKSMPDELDELIEKVEAAKSSE